MPLLPAGSTAAPGLIQRRIRQCEAHGVSILCCPEASLGGLADYSQDPFGSAIPADRLNAVLEPLASDIVTTIVGFTELGGDGRLFNAAAVFHRGSVAGLYRKLHPAVRRSIYAPGWDLPVFRIGELRFAIVICYDSNFPELAQQAARQEATALFVPSNNGLPHERAHASVAEEARAVDTATATANRLWVIRADVAGRTDQLMSYGSSAIVDPAGTVIQTARRLSEDLILTDIDQR